MENNIHCILSDTPELGHFIITQNFHSIGNCFYNTYNSDGWQGIYIANHPTIKGLGLCYWLSEYTYYFKGVDLVVNTNKIYIFALHTAKYFKTLKKISLYSYWNDFILKQQLVQLPTKNDTKKCTLGSKI